MLFEARDAPPPAFPPLRDEADDVRRLDALPLFALPLFVPLRDAVVFRDELVLREAVDLLPLPLFELLLLGLEPFELRELACRLFVERVLPWAICPSLGRSPRSQFAYPLGDTRNAWGTRLQAVKSLAARLASFGACV